MQRDAIVDEFTRQAEAFNKSAFMRSALALDALVALLPLASEQRWIETACGPGLIARAIAPRVREVVAADITPTMLEVGAREAAAAGLGNVRFLDGDATRLPFEDGAFDGSVTRFSLHHIPIPSRVVAEMARVVRPGGYVALGDHLTVDDADGAAWHEEVERLRDPSHWACLTPARLRALGARAGLELVEERVVRNAIDFDDWIRRGSGGAAAPELVEAALAERPGGIDGFRVETDSEGRRWLNLRLWQGLWRRP